MIVILFLAMVQFVSSVPMIREQPQLFDEVEGVLVEVPEYEDPLMLEHQLSAMGAMPIFTLLDTANKQTDHKEDDISEKLKIAQSKKVIDDVIFRLQSSRSKLDKGVSSIYTDLEKSIQNLKKLERISRPDARQVLSSLQALMSMAKPLMVYNAKERVTTNKPKVVAEKPLNPDSQTIAVRVIPTEKSIIKEKPVSDEKAVFDEMPVSDEKSVSDERPIFDEKPVIKDTLSQSQDMRSEIISEEEKSDDDIFKKSIDSGKGFRAKSQELVKKPEVNLKDEKNPEEEELMSYKAKFSWKSEGML